MTRTCQSSKNDVPVRPMSFTSPVTQALDKKGIPYRVFRHPGVVHSLEQAALERGQQPEQVVRSILRLA
jgi:hypothetical protein